MPIYLCPAPAPLTQHSIEGSVHSLGRVEEQGEAMVALRCSGKYMVSTKLARQYLASQYPQCQPDRHYPHLRLVQIRQRLHASPNVSDDRRELRHPQRRGVGLLHFLAAAAVPNQAIQV